MHRSELPPVPLPPLRRTGAPLDPEAGATVQQRRQASQWKAARALANGVSLYALFTGAHLAGVFFRRHAREVQEIYLT